MDKSILIKCEDVCKKFCIDEKKSMLYGGMDVFLSMIGFPPKRDTLRKHEIWALRDINFEVRRGETLGIIGVNGAGKSTLLRVLSGIYPPDAGTVSIRGPIGALISAGAGFHPDMTGRENIYLNGTMVGLKKKEIDVKLEEIIEFAEIGEFIDTPVRFYSSGMYVRLGFSIAVNIRPRILLIDEILSVGDITFQNKCFRKIKELRESVEGILFVSHNLDHVRNICTDLIILEGGKIIYRGEVGEGIILYQTHTNRLKQKSMEAELSAKAVPGAFAFDSSDVAVENIEIGDETISGNKVSAGDDIKLRIYCNIKRHVARPVFGIGLYDERDVQVIWQTNQDFGKSFDSLVPGRYKLDVIFQKPAIVGGIYTVNVSLRDAHTCELLTKHLKLLPFTVTSNRFSRAIVACDSSWNLERI